MRSLGEMRGSLSQLSSDNHHLMDNYSHLMDNYSHLTRTVELHHTEIEDIASNMIAAMQNLTSKMDSQNTPA